ncbi:SphA family protein [Undibacterium pigrum]|uniref:Outer membrane putative beta-barrel porin/alpha-amylase n=1 Tax=Undibacterium pigrum TaxID=401470 RepID=A0A318J1M4_9BURK|nr:transporter [Undibacterium pigrum]PXX40177.1 outer membrane putative beta-barrel porin/alpha-amylase [Undibacterium pigrum]
MEQKHKTVLHVGQALGGLALACCTMTAMAGEGYKLRQSPVGVFGGEMAASLENPGFFGTAALSHTNIYKVVDGDGNDISLPARNIPLPTGTVTRGAVPDGTYALTMPAAAIHFEQPQTQINILAGYLTQSTYNGGHIAFAMNVPLIRQSRSFTAVSPEGTISPTPNPALPAALRGAIGAVAAAANAQVQAGVASTLASQNADTSGMGDTELSMVWIRQQERLKIAAGVSLFVPTGNYNKDRGPNPGFGNFYTLRPGVAVSYSLNPHHGPEVWDSGVTIAGRLSFGMNSTNKDTNYRSGNYVYAEAGIVKVMGNWAVGSNVLAINQVTDDSGTGAGAGTAAGGNRYKTYAAGPFISYKLPGKEAGFNLHYSQSFGSSNALMSRTLQLRFIKAW